MNIPLSTSRSRRAFTLIELLVVIAIIAILAGLLLPVTSAVMENTRRVQAKHTELQMVTAVKSYQTDYGVYPVPPNAPQGSDYVFGTNPMTTAQLMDVLRADGQPPYNSGATNLNPRQVVYIEMPVAKNQLAGQSKNGIGPDGFPYDPWGTTYFVAVDANYDNGLANPYKTNAGFSPIGTGVIVVSFGKDKQSNLNFGGGGNADKNMGLAADDVISWQ